MVTVNGTAAFTTEATYTAQTGDTVTVLSANEYGALSAVSEALTIGDSSGIDDVNAADADDNSPAYNVGGQRVSKSYRGIVIRNGKKYVKR